MYLQKTYAVTVIRVDVVMVYAPDKGDAEGQASRFIQNKMALGIKESRSVSLMSHAVEAK